MPGGYIQIGSQDLPVYTDEINMWAIGCSGDKIVIECNMIGHVSTKENYMNGDWIKIERRFGFGGTTGWFVISAPSSNQYAIFVGSIWTSYIY